MIIDEKGVVDNPIQLIGVLFKNINIRGFIYSFIMGTNEFIEKERQLQPDRELNQDESLEKAMFRVEDVEKISLI